MMNRNQLETEIEKQTHKFVSKIREHTYDFTHIYAMRNKLGIDKAVLEQVLGIVRTAINDGFMSKVDDFKKDIQKSLDQFTETENPTQHVS